MKPSYAVPAGPVIVPVQLNRESPDGKAETPLESGEDCFVLWRREGVRGRQRERVEKKKATPTPLDAP